jgi:hypothetical protein
MWLGLQVQMDFILLSSSLEISMEDIAILPEDLKEW